VESKEDWWTMDGLLSGMQGGVMNDWKVWFKLCVVSWLLVLLMGIGLAYSIKAAGDSSYNAKQLAATVKDLEDRNRAINTRIQELVTESQRQLAEAITATRLSGEVTGELTTAVRTSDRLTERLVRIDQLTGVIVTAISGLLEAERITHQEEQEPENGTVLH